MKDEKYENQNQVIDLVNHNLEQDSIYNFNLSSTGQTYNITIANIIGGMEIPQAISFFLEKHKYDGAIAIGIIKKGATKHDEYVTQQALNGISHLALTHK